ncbi:MAG: hemolysin family protein [Planctomycetota bacterium]
MTELTLAAGVPIGDGAGGGDASAEAWLLLAGYAALALVVSFLCSMLEASLLSLPRSHVQLLVEQGKPVGTLLLRMKNHLDRPLAAILTLNTIAHTIGAAGVGAQVLNIFGSAWVFASSVIITLAILYLSEIVPKGLGATFAKPLAPFTGRTIQTLEWLTAPFVWVASVIGRVFGGMESSDVTRDEVGVYARMGEAAGELRPQESRVIRNLLRLRDVPVADVMTPRSVVFMLQADATCGDVVEEHSPIRFTRIPIYNNDRDDVLGFVLRKQVLEAVSEDQSDRKLRELIQPLEAIRDVTPVSEALDRMTAGQQHMLLCHDEFGQNDGLVTLEDCVETLLGVEIVDETDSVEDMRALARERSAARRDRVSPVTVKGVASKLEKDSTTLKGS